MIILNLLQKHGMVTSGDEICLWGNWGTRLIIDSQGNIKRDWWDKHLNGYNKGNVDTPASWLKPVEDIKISLKDFTLTILESEKDRESIAFIANHDAYQFKIDGLYIHTRKGWKKIFDMQFVTFE